jgi:hypothetical protein
MANNTAWGEIDIEFGTPGNGDLMSSTLKKIGTVKEESLSVEKEDGTKLELYGTGHILVDELKTDPKLTIKGIVIGISKENVTEFWDATPSGTGATEKIEVASLVSKKKYSVRLASKVSGSDTLEAPYCSVVFSPAFSEKEGWTAEFAFTMIKGASGKLFHIGKVS